MKTKLLTAAAAAAGIALVSTALYTVSANDTDDERYEQAASSGAFGIELDESGVGAANISVSGMEQGDSEVSYGTLLNTGSTSVGFVSMMANMSNDGMSMHSAGLSLVVEQCSEEWRESDGSCPGTSSIALQAAAPMREQMSKEQALFIQGDIRPEEKAFLKFTYTRGASAHDSRVDGQTSAHEYTFRAESKADVTEYLDLRRRTGHLTSFFSMGSRTDTDAGVIRDRVTGVTARPTGDVRDQSGVTRSGATLLGSSGRYEVPWNRGFHPQGQTPAVELWVKISDGWSDGDSREVLNSGSMSMRVQRSGDKYSLSASNGGSSDVVDLGAVTERWTHVYLSVVDGESYLHINGDEVTRWSAPVSWYEDNSPLIIGGNGGPELAVDNIAFFDADMRSQLQGMIESADSGTQNVSAVTGTSLNVASTGVNDLWWSANPERSSGDTEMWKTGRLGNYELATSEKVGLDSAMGVKFTSGEGELLGMMPDVTMPNVVPVKRSASDRTEVCGAWVSTDQEALVKMGHKERTHGVAGQSVLGEQTRTSRVGGGWSYMMTDAYSARGSDISSLLIQSESPVVISDASCGSVSSVNVSWEKVLGAKKYLIYVNDSLWGESLDRQVDVQLPPEHIAEVRVVAVDAWGKHGPSGEAEVVRPDVEVHETVAGLWRGSVVSSDAATTCMIDSSQGVLCRGNNDRGQLASGSTASVVGWSSVGSLSEVIDIDVHDGTVCAAKADGTVWCWGDNRDHIVDATDDDAVTEPRRIRGINQAVEVSVTGRSACALSNKNTVHCWGDESAQAQGQVDAAMVNHLYTSASFRDLDMSGDSGGCVVSTEVGRLLCWGDGVHGFFDIGSMRYGSMPGARSYSAGSDHMCVVNGDDGISCSGRNQSWGSASFDSFGKDVKKVATHGNSTCFVRFNGQWGCVGDTTASGDGALDVHFAHDGVCVSGLDGSFSCSALNWANSLVGPIDPKKMNRNR